MNWGKLDAALAAAVGEPGARSRERSLTLFVQLDPLGGPIDGDELSRLGIDVATLTAGSSGDTRGTTTEGVGICTVTVAAAAVAALSEQPWVRYLRLSSTAELFDDGPPSSVPDG